MKTFIKKLKICLIAVFSFFLFVPVKAQTIEQTLLFAREQAHLNNYSAAINAYQRVLFFDKHQYYPEIYSQLGDCYFEIRNFEKAAEYYDLAYYSLKNDSLKNEILFKKTASLLLINNYKFALIELFSLGNNLSEYFEQKKHFYLGITYFGLGQFDLSENHFLQTLNDDYTLQKLQLKESFIKNKRIDRIKPKTAKILSMIIPGLGQFYSGDIKNGINSFLLLGAFAALYINTSINFSIFEAYISVFPWYQRYYAGGFKRAEINAKNRTEEKRALVYQELIKTIESAKSEGYH